MTYGVILTGSRSWTDETVIDTALAALLNRHGRADLVLVHGACPTGADAIADRLAAEYGITRDPHPAAWDDCAPECPARSHRRIRARDDVHHPGTLPDYCPGAGPRRNARMVGLGADEALVYIGPHSYGTANCWRQIKDARIPWTRWTA